MSNMNHEVVVGDFAPPQVPDKFRVADEDSANWLIKKIVEARQYTARVKAWADREVRRAERDEDFFLSRFGPQLQAWATLQVEALGGRRKSINLPAGSVGYRTCPAKLVVEDEEQVLRWAKAMCPAAVVTVMTISKTVLNDHFAATGELADGVRHESKTERFYVK
jgi:hypothetical protein